MCATNILCIDETQFCSYLKTRPGRAEKNIPEYRPCLVARFRSLLLSRAKVQPVELSEGRVRVECIAGQSLQFLALLLD